MATSYRQRASRRKTKAARATSHAIVHIRATYNNTMFTITDRNGMPLLWSSAGRSGFKGSKKKSPFAATTAGEEIAKRALDLGITSVTVRVCGPGQGRDHAIRALNASGLNITMITDVTPLPYNGCRLPKRRRG